MDSYTKGLVISNSEVIKNAHNSFKKVEPFIFDSVKGDEKEDAFHFIAYIQQKNKVYELDGLQ
jgi:ubiquitin carboxyl-terminal hydrolase L5